MVVSGFLNRGSEYFGQHGTKSLSREHPLAIIKEANGQKCNI